MPLHIACQEGHLEMVKELLAAGADKDAATKVRACKQGCHHQGVCLNAAALELDAGWQLLQVTAAGQTGGHARSAITHAERLAVCSFALVGWQLLPVTATNHMCCIGLVRALSRCCHN